MREVYRSPPQSVSGYVAYVVHYDTGKKTTVLEHREVMEVALGRKLLPYEVVHHRNHLKTDNRLDNLELLTAEQHGKLHSKEQIAEWADAKCLGCGKEWKIRASVLRGNAKKGRAGPFCSKTCAGRYGAAVQARKTSANKL